MSKRRGSLTGSSMNRVVITASTSANADHASRPATPGTATRSPACCPCGRCAGRSPPTASDVGASPATDLGVLQLAQTQPTSVLAWPHRAHLATRTCSDFRASTDSRTCRLPAMADDREGRTPMRMSAKLRLLSAACALFAAVIVVCQANPLAGSDLGRVDLRSTSAPMSGVSSWYENETLSNST